MLKPLAILLSDDGTPPKRIQLLRVGKFNSPQYGKFAITSEMLLSMVANFAAKVRGYDDGKLPVDYFHENDKIAAGWITGLSLDAGGNELWADVDWTPTAAKKLSDKELRYVSAEFSFDYKGNEGEGKFGPTLFGAGLTNRPFVKGMEPIVGLYEGNQMNLEQALAEIKKLQDEIASLKKPPAAPAAPADEKDSPEMAEMKKKLADSEAKNAASDAAAKCAELKGKFDLMLSEGKVCEAQREPFMKSDLVKFTENAKPIKLHSVGKGSVEESEDEIDANSKTPAQDKVMNLAEKEMKDSKLSSREAIAKVLKGDAKLAAEYSNEVKLG